MTYLHNLKECISTNSLAIDFKLSQEFFIYKKDYIRLRMKDALIWRVLRLLYYAKCQTLFTRFDLITLVDDKTGEEIEDCGDEIIQFCRQK